jgi:hypothetical protein
MTLPEISRIRLHNQKIVTTEFKTAKEIVSYMGAIQAQDFTMSKWAIGLRLLNSHESDIDHAIDNGEIIRTHVMRPTWHFVAAEDLGWMVTLTSNRIKSTLKTRQKNLELSEDLILKCLNIIEKEFQKSSDLTRSEISQALQKEKIRTDENRLSHILLCAELEGMVCSGKIKNGKPTHSLISERVTFMNKMTLDESLAELAKRYFTSHGPATLKDFIWWSGLSARDARNALEFVRSSFISEKVGSEEYWLTDRFPRKTKTDLSVYFLPAYDEFLISYADRSASISPTYNKKTISQNGIFRPVIVVDGKVAGIWKKTKMRDQTIIETSDFESRDKIDEEHVKNCTLNVCEFYGKNRQI